LKGARPVPSLVSPIEEAQLTISRPRANTWWQQMRIGVLLFPCVLLFSGCAASRYSAPVASFRDKTHQTIGVLSDFYSSRNSYEIDLYLQGIAVDASLPVQTIDASGAATPLGRPESSAIPEQI